MRSRLFCLRALAVFQAGAATLTYHGRMSKKKKIQRKRQAAEQRKPFAFDKAYDVVVVGAGAAGLSCAVSCMRQACEAGVKAPRILLVEQGKRLGASILRSGNGRCNFSNSRLETERFKNHGFVERTLSALPDKSTNPIVRWFERLGLVWSEAPLSGGLLYPFSNKASSVLEALTGALPSNSVDIHTCVRAQEIASAQNGEGYLVYLEEAALPTAKDALGASADPSKAKRASVHTKCVVIAAGGGFPFSLVQGCAPEAGMRPWQPTLGPLSAEFPEGVSADELDGIRVQAQVSLPGTGFSEKGEVLFRSYGASGIVVFNASRYAKPGDTLLLDMLPEMDCGKAQEMMMSRAELFQGKPAREVFRGFMLPELGSALLAAAGVSPKTPLDREGCNRLVQAMKAFPLRVCGIADVQQCQVHRGGIDPQAVCPETLQLKGHPGLYALGEALDVDGPCGGYNLHWAWACGILAGKSIAQQIGKEQS